MLTSNSCYCNVIRQFETLRQMYVKAHFLQSRKGLKSLVRLGRTDIVSAFSWSFFLAEDVSVGPAFVSQRFLYHSGLLTDRPRKVPIVFCSGCISRLFFRSHLSRSTIINDRLLWTVRSKHLIVTFEFCASCECHVLDLLCQRYHVYVLHVDGFCVHAFYRPRSKFNDIEMVSICSSYTRYFLKRSSDN